MDVAMRTWSTEAADEAGTRAVARALAAVLAAGDTVLLEGELGAGKTTFARELAYGLGVPEDEPVTSPTFALAHEYELERPPGAGSRERAARPGLLVHADLYRLSHPDELLELGLEGTLGTSAIGLVEWGERFAEAIPGVALILRLTIKGDDARRIALEATSDRGDAIIRAVSTALGARS